MHIKDIVSTMVLMKKHKQFDIALYLIFDQVQRCWSMSSRDNFANLFSSLILLSTITVLKFFSAMKREYMRAYRQKEISVFARSSSNGSMLWARNKRKSASSVNKYSVFSSYVSRNIHRNLRSMKDLQLFMIAQNTNQFASWKV